MVDEFSQRGQDVARYAVNLREELDGAALYAAIAAAERDPSRKDLFTQLSQAEAGHAELWRQRLIAAGATPEAFKPSTRTRVLGRLARYFGPEFVLPTVAAGEFAEQKKYSGQTDAGRSPPTSAAMLPSSPRPRVFPGGPGSIWAGPSRVGIEAFPGTRCARRCWGPLTVWCQTSVW